MINTAQQLLLNVTFPQIKHFYWIIIIIVNVGRDGIVGIATRYGLDGPGIESLWGRDFPHPSRPALGPTFYTMGTGSLS